MATFSKLNIATTMTTGPVFVALKKLETRFLAFKTAITGVSSTLGGLTTSLGLFAGGAGLLAVIRSAEDFNKAMANSLAIMGDVSDFMRMNMVDAANDVAKAFRFSATEAAEAFFFLASAGLDVERSIAALPRVAAFAQAGQFGLSRATELATDAQSALGLKVKDTAKNLENLIRVTDVLVKANTLADAKTEEFAIALSQGAAVAGRILGAEIEEVTALLAVFADQGIKGAEAATAVGIVLRDMSDKAEKNSEVFDQLGIHVFDAAGEFTSIASVVEELTDLLGKMPPELQKTTLRLLGFQQKSLKFTQAILGSSDAIREFRNKLLDAGGTVDDVSGKQLTPFAESLRDLSAITSELGRDFFDLVDGPIIVFFDAVTTAGDRLERLIDIFKKAKAFAGIGGPVSSAEKRLVEDIRLPSLGKILAKVFPGTAIPDLLGLVDVLDMVSGKAEEIRKEGEKPFFRNLDKPPTPFPEQPVANFFEGLDFDFDGIMASIDEFEREAERDAERFGRIFGDPVKQIEADIKRLQLVFDQGFLGKGEEALATLNRGLEEFQRQLAALEPKPLGPSREELFRGRAELQQQITERLKTPFERFSEALQELEFAFPGQGEMFQRGLEDLRKRFLPEAKKQIPELFDLATIDQRIQRAALKPPKTKEQIKTEKFQTDVITILKTFGLTFSDKT